MKRLSFLPSLVQAMREEEGNKVAFHFYSQHPITGQKVSGFNLLSALNMLNRNIHGLGLSIKNPDNYGWDLFFLSQFIPT